VVARGKLWSDARHVQVVEGLGTAKTWRGYWGVLAEARAQGVTLTQLTQNGATLYDKLPVAGINRIDTGCS
jgi:hypothetical protein